MNLDSNKRVDFAVFSNVCPQIHVSTANVASSTLFLVFKIKYLPMSRSVPDGCIGYIKAEAGSVTSPGYPAGHNYTEDTECVWKLETTAGRQLNLSFSDVQANEPQGTANYIKVTLTL